MTIQVCVGIQAYVGSTTRLLERGESRAMAQHDILIRSLKKLAEDAKGENGERESVLFIGTRYSNLYTAV